jgi:hypothetical protein
MSKDRQTDEETYTLSPEEEEALKIGLESEKSGVFYTWEETIEFARKRRQEWKRPSKKPSAA